MNTSSISSPSGDAAAAAWSRNGTSSRAVCRAMVDSTKERNEGLPKTVAATCSWRTHDAASATSSPSPTTSNISAKSRPLS